MKKIEYLIFIIFFAACSNGHMSATEVIKTVTADTVNEGVKHAKFKEYKLNSDYTVIDTGKYSNDGPMSGGTYAIIKKNGILADTIDLYFGVQDLGDQTYLYHTLKDATEPGEKQSKEDLILDVKKYLLITNNHKSTLKELIPDFDDYFSSPAVINLRIYYWQIKKIDTAGKYKILAAEYSPLKKETKNYYLKDDYIETDDSGYFPQPYSKNDTIYFDAGKDKLTKFSKDFKRYN